MTILTGARIPSGKPLISTSSDKFLSFETWNITQSLSSHSVLVFYTGLSSHTCSIYLTSIVFLVIFSLCGQSISKFDIGLSPLHSSFLHLYLLSQNFHKHFHNSSLTWLSGVSDPCTAFIFILYFLFFNERLCKTISSCSQRRCSPPPQHAV